MKLRTYQLSRHLGNAVGLRCLLATLAAFLAIGLCAQESESEEVETDKELIELAPFTVTGEVPTGYVQTTTLSATRANTKILDLPHSVQIVTKEQIDDMGIDQIGEAPRYVSNVDTRSANEDVVGIRGFSSGQFYVDGTVSEGGGLNGDRLQAFVERVEVVKGASAVLYGAAPAGGLVNVVTLKPLTFKRHSIQFGIGDQGYYSGEFDSTGPLNAKGSLRYRVTGSVTEAESGSHPFFSPAKRRGVMSQLYVRPLDRTEFLFQHSYTNYQGHLSPQWRPYWNSETNEPWGLPFNWYRGEANDSADTDLTWMAATWIQTFSDNWHLKATVNYTNKFGVQEWGYTRTVPNEPDLLLRNFRHLERTIEVYNGQFDLAGQFDIGGARNKLVLGGQLRQDEQDNEYTDRYYPTFVTIDPTYGHPLYKGQEALELLQSEFRDADGNPIPRAGSSTAYVSTSEWCGINNLCKRGWAEVGEVMNDVRDRTDVKITQAFYWNDIISFWKNAEGDDRIHLTAGGRWDYYRQTTTDWEWPDTRPGGSRDRRITDEDTLQYFPRYAVLGKVTPQLSAYVMYSEAMRPVLGFEPTTGQKFEPEIAEQIEGGVKFSLLDGRFTGSASVFEIVRTNIKETDHVRFITVQSKEATATGWEFDSHFQVTDEFQLLGGFSALDQEISASIAETYTGDTEEINPSQVGDAVRNIPDSTGYFWAKYRFLEGPLKGFNAAIGGTYIGERYIEVDRSRTLPAYLILDAMLKYDFQDNLEGFSVRFNVSNLEDQEIWTTGTGTFGKPGYLRRMRFHVSYTF
jgi:iron complex outermembrane receptor protein